MWNADSAIFVKWFWVFIYGPEIISLRKVVPKLIYIWSAGCILTLGPQAQVHGVTPASAFWLGGSGATETHPRGPAPRISMQNSTGNSKMTLRSREKYQKMFKNAFEDAQQSRNSEDIDVAKGPPRTHEDHLGWVECSLVTVWLDGLRMSFWASSDIFHNF